MEAGIDASVDQSNSYNDQHQSHSHSINEPLSPRVPPKLPLLTTSNLHATESNSKINVNGNDSPDGFYRNFKPASQPTSPVKKVAMASTTTNASIPRPSQSSLRSNGNGTTPKYPSLAATRSGLKPTNTNRSVSAPVADRAASKPTTPLNSGSKPSVKDLTKRFDQGGSPAPARKIPVKAGTTVKTGTASRASYLAARTGVSETPPSVSGRAGMATRNTTSRPRSPTTTRSTQRSRFTTEDAQSTNSLSSQARPDRSRMNVTTKLPTAQSSQSIKSPQSLSSPKLPQPSSKTPQTPSRPSNISSIPKTSRVPPSPKTTTKKPLFGEVTSPEGVGFGINASHVRSTSDSELHPPLWTAKPDAPEETEIATVSFTGLTKSTTLPVKTETKRSMEAPRMHNRSRSDFTGVKSTPVSRQASNASNTSTASTPANRLKKPRIITATAKSSPANSAKPATSRIPLGKPTAKLSSPSTSSSAASTRPPSPSNAILSTERRPSGTSTSSRAPTPVGRSRSRQGRSTKGRNASKSPAPASTLNAYINIPEPKKSPTLRSSRPRQPLTSSTASSRVKAAERMIPEKQGAPHHTTGARITRAGSSNELRSTKKAPDGHVDFAARRARIQKAVSKTISDAEKRELRRQTEKAEKAAQARLDTVTDEGPSGAAAALSANANANRHESANKSESATKNAVDTPTPNLSINTSRPTADTGMTGIPGAVPGPSEDEAPQSAISAITDFDAEPQTEAPQLFKKRSSSLNANPASAVSASSNGSQSSRSGAALSADVEVVNGVGSIPIVLAPSSAASLADVHSTPGTPQVPTPTLSEGEALSEARESPNPNSKINNSTDTEQTPSLYGIAEEQHPEPEAEDFYRSPIHKRISSTQSFSARSAALSKTSSNTSNDSATRQTRAWSASRVSRVASDSSDSTTRAFRLSSPQNNKSSPKSKSVPPPAHVSRESIATEFSLDGSDGGASPIEQGPPPPPKEPLEPLGPPVPPKIPGYSPQPSPRKPPASPVKRTPRSSSVDGLGLTGISFPIHPSPHSPGPKTVALPPLPDHSPPPLPVLSDEVWGQRSPHLSDATASVSRNTSVHRGSQISIDRPIEFRRASDDIYTPHGSSSITARSSTQGFGEMEKSGSESANPDKLETTVSHEQKVSGDKVRHRLFQRYCVIKEWIDTEALYLKDMHVVEEIYKGTAEACPSLEYADIKAIFRNIDQIVSFTTAFVAALRVAASSIYVKQPKSRTKAKTLQSIQLDEETNNNDRNSTADTLVEESDEEKDRRTTVGATFLAHVKEMQDVYAEFLKNSELASTRLQVSQGDAAVQVWLEQCGLAAKDLTNAWSLDALLVKPVQRIARYPLLIGTIIKQTPEDHPDLVDLQTSMREAGEILGYVDELKRRVQTVGKIVNGRKRKESEVKTGISKILRRDKSDKDRMPEDPAFVKHHERFQDDYLRLQVVLRDVEFYTRQVEAWAQTFLRLLSAMELVMRSNAGSHYAEIESKWIQFNLGMRNMGTTAMEFHLMCVKVQVIEPFEQVIRMYEAPSALMKKRAARRLDFEKAESLKSSNKKIDQKLAEYVDQYTALNEILKMELPKLSTLTGSLGQMCMSNFIGIQQVWQKLWKDKILDSMDLPPLNQLPPIADYILDVMESFNRDNKYYDARLKELCLTNCEFHASRGTCVHSDLSKTNSREDEISTKSRATTISSTSRARGFSQHSEGSPNPSTTTTDSGVFTLPPLTNIMAMSDLELRALKPHHTRTDSSNDESTDRDYAIHPPRERPVSNRSNDAGYPRASVDSNNYDTPASNGRPFSGIFHSALPMEDNHHAHDSMRSSRASSRDRDWIANTPVLYLAASLFEFNIDEAKYEGGYVYLTYAAGEIFDVIGEKGELWLAKNQDDPNARVGWIWSKHFARLAGD